jgi:hypothetical protein
VASKLTTSAIDASSLLGTINAVQMGIWETLGNKRMATLFAEMLVRRFQLCQR